MAVVKTNYVKRGKGEKARAKATIRYIMHRPGKEGERITRRLFGFDGVMEKQQAYRMIDAAKKGTIFFRFVISPDPKREDSRRDLDLWALTTQTILRLEERLQKRLQFVAAEHADHRPHRHIHAVVLIEGKLSTTDLQALRQAATELALAERLERDLAWEHQKQRARQFARQRASSKAPGHIWQPQAKPLVTYKTCFACGELQPVSRREAKRCSSCGVRLTRGQDVSVGYEEAQWN